MDDKIDLTMDSDIFKRAFDQTSLVIPKKLKGRDWKKCVCMYRDDEQFVMQGTNGRVSIKSPMMLMDYGDEEWDIDTALINAKFLKKYLSMLDIQGKIDLTSMPDGENKNNLKIQVSDHDVYTAILKGEKHQDAILDIPWGYPICGTITNMALFSDILEKVYISCNRDNDHEYKSVLEGVLFRCELKEDEQYMLRIASTDGYRLTEALIDIQADEEWEMIVPHKAIDCLNRIMSSGYTDLLIGKDSKNNYASFHTNNGPDIVTELIYGEEYPEYQHLLPNKEVLKKPVIVPVIEFKKVLDVALTFSDFHIDIEVIRSSDLALEDHLMILKSENDYGEVNGWLVPKGDNSSSDINIRVGRRYLKELSDTMNEKMMDSFNMVVSPDSGALIIWHEDINFITVVMPVSKS